MLLSLLPVVVLVEDKCFSSWLRWKSLVFFLCLSSPKGTYDGGDCNGGGNVLFICHFHLHNEIIKCVAILKMQNGVV